MKKLILFTLCLLMVTSLWAQTTAYGLTGGGLRTGKAISPKFTATVGMDIKIADAAWNTFNRTQYFFTEGKDGEKELQMMSSFIMLNKPIISTFFAEIGSGALYSIEDGADIATGAFRIGLGVNLWGTVTFAIYGDYIPIVDDYDQQMVYTVFNLKP